MLGMTWMAVLFLTFVPLLATDLVTLFGLLLPRLAPSLRGWAVVAGGALSVTAIIQGVRPPIVQDYEVGLRGLPKEMDGTVLVVLSDLHLGSQLGERWLSARVAQVEAQRPDLVLFLGDIFEGHGPPQEELFLTLRRLSAPLGVWAVPGQPRVARGARREPPERDWLSRPAQPLGRSPPRFCPRRGRGSHSREANGARRRSDLASPVGPPSRFDPTAFTHAVAGREGRKSGCRLDALWPHPRGANLALRLSYSPLLSSPGGVVRGGRNADYRLPRHRHVGTPDETLESRRNPAGNPARKGITELIENLFQGPGVKTFQSRKSLTFRTG